MKKFVPIYVHKIKSYISDINYKKRTNDIIGAELDYNFDDNFAKKEALEFPPKKVSKSIDMSRKERDSIRNLQLGARAGAA